MTSFMRFFYRVVLMLWFCGVAFWMGPNMIHFGRPWGLSLADFEPIAASHVPVIQAIKRYERDEAHLPERIEDLVPKYLGENWKNSLVGQGGIGPSYWSPGTFEYRILIRPGGFYHQLRYELNSGGEFWEVRGTKMNGRLSIPPVTLPETIPKPSSD